MNQIQLEFMAALTVSLGGAHIRIKNHVCAEWDLKVIKKIDWVLSTSLSPWCDKCAQKQYLVEPVCQFSEPLLCRTTIMLSYYALCYYVEPLALAEWIAQTSRHTFFAFSISFFWLLGYRTTRNQHQALSATVCDTPQQLLDLCQCSKIKSIVARKSNLSHCAICLWLFCWATPLWHADCVESLLYYSQRMRHYVEPLALCWTTCASYATCHLTKHTRLVLFPTRDLLSLFPSRVLSSIHLCDLNKVDITSPNLVVRRFFLRLTFYISLSFSLSLHLFFCFFLGWRTPKLITGLSRWWAPD